MSAISIILMLSGVGMAIYSIFYLNDKDEGLWKPGIFISMACITTYGLVVIGLSPITELFSFIGSNWSIVISTDAFDIGIMTVLFCLGLAILFGAFRVVHEILYGAVRLFHKFVVWVDSVLEQIQEESKIEV